MGELLKMEALLSREDVLSIPEKLCPMLVFSDNLRSFFSWGIKQHEQGCYNHFMWLIKPGHVASQNFLFQEEPISNYFDRYRLKFWYCPTWTDEERLKIIGAITNDLDQPWYKRMYDVVAIIGQLLHQDWIQIPGEDICSDKAKYIQMNDTEYTLCHPDPEDVNRWLMVHLKYLVYGRYLPD